MNPIHGILFKLASVAVFVGMASLIKAADVPAGEAVFFRSFFALPVILTWLLLRGDLKTGLRTQNRMGHFWRGLIGTTAMGLGFAGLTFLPLTEVQAIGYAAPLMVVILAAMFLGENVGLFRLGSVGLGLVGVLVVLSPRLSVDVGEAGAAEMLGAVLVLGSALFAALAQVFVRKMVATETTSAIVFYFTITSTLLSFVTLPYGWVMPDARTAAMLVAAGLCGGVGQIFLTSSYRCADASVVAPFEYSSILLGLLVGYFVFAEVPARTTLLGAALVVVAGVIIILRERHLGLEREKQRKAMTPQG